MIEFLSGAVTLAYLIARKWFVRGGINHFQIPTSWDILHRFAVLPVDEWPHPYPRPELRDTPITVVGELCTPEDTLARDMVVSCVRPGDIVVFTMAGSYGYEFATMLESSRENTGWLGPEFASPSLIFSFSLHLPPAFARTETVPSLRFATSASVPALLIDTPAAPFPTLTVSTIFGGEALRSMTASLSSGAILVGSLGSIFIAEVTRA